MARAAIKTKLTERERLQALGWLLADTVIDLSVPAEVFNDYLKFYGSNATSKTMLEGVVRMCRFSVVMAVCKLEDALKDHGEAYKDAPYEIKNRVKSFRKHFREKDYLTLRSKFVAHNFDAYETHTYQDGERIADGIYGVSTSDLKSYFDWIKPPKDRLDLRGESPVWIACDLKEYIRSRADLVPRTPPL